MDPSPAIAHFNLWTEPWITLVRPDGHIEEMGMERAILRAHEYAALFETSPLVVAGTHRLLAAVLQDIFDPQYEEELAKLWQAGRFPEQPIKDFGATYSSRFDIFDRDTPFMQSSDLPAVLADLPTGKRKEVTYLMPEMPAATAATHYRHGRADEQVLCAPCAAKGLVLLSAFATSGGSGIRPSINGVPPVYVLPGGKSLFEALAASLVVPAYQPEVRHRQGDRPWWKRKSVVGQGEEVIEVGYIESLTFPARRVRLYPDILSGPCNRCGRIGGWGVQILYFQMGEYRSKEAPFWFDPFAAYLLPGEKGKASDQPKPVRPQEGQALWREYASLFLHSQTGRSQRPRVLEQLAELATYYGVVEDDARYPLRCVGMRTDMKAKVFEWVDDGFEVPLPLLRDDLAGDQVQNAVDFAGVCEREIDRVFRKNFVTAATRHSRTRKQMKQSYWASLAGPFRRFVLQMARSNNYDSVSEAWVDTVSRHALVAFLDAADTVGDDAVTLRQRVQAEQHCRRSLKKAKEKSVV